MTQSTQNFNFERCEDEPIHIPESVQSYGFLIAFNYEDLEVSIVSENCNTIFADEIIGKGFLDILKNLFSKYDQVFLPEFSSDAMENVGCITYSDGIMCSSQHMTTP